MRVSGFRGTVKQDTVQDGPHRADGSAHLPKDMMYLLTFCSTVLSFVAYGGAFTVLPAVSNDCHVRMKADHNHMLLQGSTDEAAASDETVPDILQPFLPAADPKYMCRGSIGENDFVISREGAPKAEELSNENIIKIVQIECSDLEVNTLVWKCLGYRFNPETEEWGNDECFPNWKEKYPTPPDLIGMRRIYSREVDQISLRSNQALVRSVPAHAKQSLKTHLKPLGFRGYKYAELTPNKTRRAQCANWLLYYRDELFGYSLEELRERKKQKQAEEAAKATEDGDNWKPPVKEVF